MKRFLVCLTLAVGLAPRPGRAGDLGDLVFPSDFTQQRRAELIYENLHRNLTLTSENPERHSAIRGDALLVRYHLPIHHDASLSVDLGAQDSNNGDFDLIGGIGARYLAYDRARLRVGTFGQLRYAPKISSRLTLADIGRAEVEHDFLEAEVGALASFRFRVADYAAIVPYAGPFLSILRLSGEVQDTDRPDDDFRAKERWLVGLAAGVSFEFHGVNGIRFEMRMLDNLNLSVAAAMVF